MSEKGSVLIVDDNESLCTTLCFILNRKGYATATASDGPDAIKLTEETPFDLTLMDIRMPLMNGVDAFKEIKKFRPDAAVVMMTAYSVEELVQEALEEGAFSIIYKPLDIEKIVALIEEAKRNKKGAFILVVDDNEGTRVTLRNILVNKGYTVGLAESGDEAVAVVREQRYDLLFVDLKMPVLNGYETYLAVKEVQQDIVAVMMTAYRRDMTELVEAALHDNAYTCINKPLNIEYVLKIIEEIMMKKQVAG